MSRASLASTPSNVAHLFNTRPATAGSGIGGIAAGLQNAVQGLRQSRPMELPRGGEMDMTMTAMACSPMKRERPAHESYRARVTRKPRNLQPGAMMNKTMSHMANYVPMTPTGGPVED